MARHLTPQELIALMPEWRGADLQIQPLTGGITNTLYRITLDAARDYVVRCYGQKTELFIDRQIERENIARMAATGVTPRLVRYLPEHHITVVEFVPGRALRNQDFLDPGILAKAVRPIQRIHTSEAQLPRVFEPMVEVRRLHQIYAKMGLRHPEFDIAGTLRRLEQIAAIAAVPASGYVPCHNDLLADNFILVDAPEQWGGLEVLLIDWEYAGMSAPYYDIADLLQEILAPPEVEARFLRLYWGEGDLDAHHRLTDLHKPFPDIYWFLWSLIQRNISSLDFDYYGYGKTKYDNAQANLRLLRERWSA